MNYKGIIDFSGINLSGSIDDGGKHFNISGAIFDRSKIGVMGSLPYNFDGSVVSVSLYSLPAQLSYEDGEYVTEAKLNGLSVLVTYESGRAIVIPYDNRIVTTNPDVPHQIFFGQADSATIDVVYIEGYGDVHYREWYVELNITKKEANPYLTFSSPNIFTLATANASKNWDGTLEYSTDAQNWDVWDGTTTLASAASEGIYCLYLRGYGNTVITGKWQASYSFALIGSEIGCNGDIRTLLNYSDVDNSIMSTYCYASLFRNCGSLVSAPSLPATTLANGCYTEMFRGTSIAVAPRLPATTLSDQCYTGMFSECALLSVAPELNAQTMVSQCYTRMFEKCISLKRPPALPSLTLAYQCYASMFIGCSSLSEAPLLPATTLANVCYENMFGDCTSITAAPSLPATTLANSCYNGMFHGCTSLVSATSLPALTLTPSCYTGMFRDCTSLASLPALPATSLKNMCYNGMFSGCVKIKLSETQTDEYQTPYRIPTSGTGTSVNSMVNMFANTGGTFTGAPTINTTYYTSNTVIPMPEPALLSIQVTALPTKRIYTVGETLDLSGIVVTGSFSDSSTAYVTANCTINDSQHVFTDQDLQEGFVHSHHVVTFYVTHPLADGGNAVDFFEVGVRAVDDTDSLLLLHLSSEPTQSLYFTQSVPNGVRINWGDGSASESSADTSAMLSHTYDSSQWSGHKAYLVHFSADAGVAWQPGMSVTSGSTTTNYGVIGVYNSKSATYPALVGFHFGSGCSLRAYSFAYCTGLAKIEIPDGTSIVPEYAFVGCGLRSVAIPASVASVGEGGLWGAISSYGCNAYITDLSAYCSISYTLSANEILSAALAVPCIYLVLNGQTLSGALKIPDGVTNIGLGALSRLHGITSIHIPSSVTTIDDYAFVGCDNLVEFTLPSTVQTAGDCLLRGGGYSNMQNIEIAAASVGAEILPATESELKVWIRSTTAELGVNLPYNSNVTIYCEPSSKPSGWGSAFNKIFSSGNAVTTIWGQTISPFATELYFTLTSNLTQPLYFTQDAANGVTIDWGDGSTPETVADLSAQASHTYAEAGDYVVRMTAGEGVTWSPGAVISNTNYSLLGNASNKNNTYPTLTAFKFGTGCNLRQYSFANCTSLAEIVIPDGTVEIPDNAFKKCTGLKKITLPTSARRAHIGSFDNATNIEEVHIKDLAAYCGFDWVAENEFSLLAYPAIGTMNIYLNGVKITDGNLVVPNGVTRVGNQAFANAAFNSVTLPDTVVSVGHGAFSSGNANTTIQSFTFGVNPISFGAHAFYNRDINAVYFQSLEMWLNSVCDPGSIGGSTPIYWSGTSVYINGTLLSGNVEIPRSIATLHALAFDHRAEITAVWIHDTVDTIEVITRTSGNTTSIYRPFTGCLSTLAIYCEDTADQSGWDSGWNGSLTVTYGQTTRPW